MRIDLFENSYKTSNASKVFFADIVCFLLVTILSVGFCFAYFSGKNEVKGRTSMANVSVEYQYLVGEEYTRVDDLYGSVNGGAVQKLTNVPIVPGDSVRIVGRAANVSNIPVYYLVNLQVVKISSGVESSEKVWYNIGSNDPQIVDGEMESDTPGIEATCPSLYKDLNDVYQVGAGSLGVDKYKDFSLTHTFEGEDYQNGDSIKSFSLEIFVHQKDHLRNGSGFENYSKYEDANGEINGYTTESIYAAHQMTGELGGSENIQVVLNIDGVSSSPISVGSGATLDAISQQNGITAENSCGWYSDEQLTIPVTEITESCTLYTKRATLDKLLFSELADGTYQATYSDKSISGDIVLPLKYNGQKVTSVMFAECTGITSVTFTPNITHLTDYAFASCTNLTSLTIPANVTNIGSNAFKDAGLTSIVLEDKGDWVGSMGDGIYTFEEIVQMGLQEGFDLNDPTVMAYLWTGDFASTIWQKISLEPTELPTDWLTLEGDHYVVTRGTSPLPTNLVIPSHHPADGLPITKIADYTNLTDIRRGAFSYYSGLTSIYLPDTITSIGNYAFSYCTGLSSIIIPASVTSIGNDTFRECSSLTSIDLPDGITSIGRGAFSYCSNLTSIDLPDGLISIGSDAFYNCSNLSSIVIPASVTSIGSNAFSSCGSLSSIVVESGNTVYDSRDNCNAIIETNTNTLIAGCKSTIIPNTVTSIGEHAFSGCGGLTSIDLPETIISIGYNTFNNCSNLSSIVIPASVISIVSGAFSYCSNLSNIVVESGNSIYDSRDNCNAIIETNTNTLIAGCKSTIIPNTVTSIGEDAFYGCSSLTSIDLPDGITSIGNYAFSHCSSLSSIIIPASVTSIGEYAFSGCSGLTSIDLPDGLTSIGRHAFNECSSLASIDLPSNLTSIGDAAFYRCSGLTSIDLPDGITSIGNYAFDGCSSLTSIDLPDGLTSIGERAFSECSGLTSIDLPDGLTSIGNYAFSYCSNLSSIVIPASVTSIGYSAFKNCANLTSLVFEESGTWLIGDTEMEIVAGTNYAEYITQYIDVTWTKKEDVQS